MTQNTLFVNKMTRNTLVYGIYSDSWKNHDIRYVSTSRSKTLIAEVLPSHPLQCIGCCQLCNRFIYNIQGGFFYWSAQFSVPKWKTMGSQSEILFQEILDLQNILIDWTTFFFLALKLGQTSQKNHPVYNIHIPGVRFVFNVVALC